MIHWGVKSGDQVSGPEVFMKRVLIIGWLLALGFCYQQASAQTNIAPRAREVLAGACKYLAQAPFFAITAEVWHEHVTQSGEKLQFTRAVNLEVRRPNRLHLDIESPHSARGFWYDGESLTVLDRKENCYSTTSMPETLDDMLDTAHDRFGIDLPLADLALSDPYQSAISRVQRGTYLGLSQALGFTCHHLAFTQDNIDWQVWIQDGPQPWIRKLVITHKNEPGAPQFTALLRNWDMTQRIADTNFAFMAPRGATRVDMRPEQPASEGGETHKQPSSAPSATGR